MSAFELVTNDASLGPNIVLEGPRNVQSGATIQKDCGHGPALIEGNILAIYGRLIQLGVRPTITLTKTGISSWRYSPTLMDTYIPEDSSGNHVFFVGMSGQTIISGENIGEFPQIKLASSLRNTLVSPFDQFEDLQPEEYQVRQLISHVRHILDYPFRDRLASRLESLLEATIEENPEELTNFPDSLGNLISVLSEHPDLAYPDVVVSPLGNITAEWHVSPSKHFTAEFLANGEVAFVVFAPRGDHTIRLSGIVPTDILISSVEHFGVLDWAMPNG